MMAPVPFALPGAWVFALNTMWSQNKVEGVKKILAVAVPLRKPPYWNCS